MTKRKLLKDQGRRELVDIPVDEDSLIRHPGRVLGASKQTETQITDFTQLFFGQALRDEVGPSGNNLFIGK
ncbi:hypothetical protein [Agrobacterium sp. 22-226-1]